MRIPRVLTIVAFCLVGCSAGQPSVQEHDSDGLAFIRWASDHAIPVDHLDFSGAKADLERLGPVLESARLVGLGESRHDTREQLLLKGRLVKYMIEDLGFKALLIEESAPHAEVLDRYVTSGKGDSREIMNELAGWYLWDTEEMLELIEWLRHFNEGRGMGSKIRIFGVDITAPSPAVRELVDDLEGAGVEVGLDEKDLGLDLQRGDFWPEIWERYSALSDEQRRELVENYRRLTGTLVREEERLAQYSSPQMYDRMVALADIGDMGNQFFVSGDREQGGAIREHGMARITLRILDQIIPGDRAILWAHNLHVARGAFRMPGLAEGDLKPMGVELGEVLGDDYLAIGATFGAGAYTDDLPPGSRTFEPASEAVMDGAMAAVDIPAFVLNLSQVEQGAPEARWLSRERKWRAQDADALLVPSESFDLVYFVDTISRSRPTPLALHRFRLQGG